MLNPERFRLFVAALESGEYRQHFNALGHVDDDGSVSYCALGVATEVARINGAPVDWRASHGLLIARDTESGEETDDTLLPSVRQWYGLDADDFHVPDEPHGTVSLTWENDIARTPFPEIAERLRVLDTGQDGR